MHYPAKLCLNRSIHCGYIVIFFDFLDGDCCHRPALVAEWAMPLAAVHAGQGSLPVRVEA